MSASYDVIIIGAGPAGCVAASKLNKEGHTVKVLEKAIFPRFVIGESLLPHCMDYLQELNLIRCVENENFQKKTGASFFLENKACDFLFNNQFTKSYDYTYQVKRAVFDNALATEVANQGAEIEFNAEVTHIETSKQLQKVKYKNSKGEELEISSKFILDASGYGRVIPKMFNLEMPVESPSRGAIFAHFKDENRSARASNNIFVHAFNTNKAWIWSIPFSDNTASVGVVGDVDLINEFSENENEKFNELVRNFPGLNGRYNNAEQLFKPKSVLNYSVSVKQLYGEGYALCGNSTEFLDPIFSSGATLAIVSGYKAADLASKQLQNQPVDWEKDYSDYLKFGIDVFRSYVNAWYDGTLQTIFFSKRTEKEFNKQICSVLAGHVWDTTNPFVKKHKTILKSMARVIELFNSKK